MGKKRNVAYYSKRISKEMGIDEEIVRRILMHGWRNVLLAMKNKEDVALHGFARIWLEKQPRQEPEESEPIKLTEDPWEELFK